MHVCKESVKAFQQGDLDTEKFDKSRSILQHRFLDYLNEVTDGMKKCYEACFDSAKVAQDMKARDASSSSPDPNSPPISPTSQRLAAMGSPGRVFGRTLSSILDESRTDIPPILEKIALWIEMNGMQTIGLFRIAGTASVVRALKADIDSGDEVDFPTTTNSHVMCSLFKAYLRELPEPLVPASMFDPLAACLKELDRLKQISILRDLVDSMPKQQAVVLDWLVAFLKRIAAGAEITKMPAKSLACLISPNILYKPNQPASVEDVSNSNLILELMMDLYTDVFSNISYATKSLDPLEKSNALAASKNKTAHSDSLESSRRASDTDLIAPLRLVGVDSTPRKSSARRRSSHRRIESDNSGSPSLAEDAGFLSDGTPSRAPKRRVKLSTEQAASTPAVDSSDPPAAEISSAEAPGQMNEKPRSGSTKSRSESKRNDSPSPSVNHLDANQGRRLSAADQKPRSRRGSDAGSHSRVRRGSKAVADGEFVKSPSSEHVSRAGSQSASVPTTDALKSKPEIIAAPLERPHPIEVTQIHITETPAPSVSPPHSPSASDSSSSAKDAARQRVSALLASSDSAPGSPKAPKSPGSTRMKAILDLVDEAPRRGDAIGGVAPSLEDSLSSSNERRRRSNSVSASESLISRYKGRDRTAGLATLSFTNAEQFNSLMDNVFSASVKAGFVVVGYSRGNALTVQGHSNTGGPEEMATFFKDEEVQYGLLRVSTLDLGRASTRDIFVQWNGSKVSNIQKGVKKGHVGEVKEIFRPYNAEVFVVTRDRFNATSVLDITSPQSTSHILD
eukprot:TRINITY_DN785_c0_g1_i3.p1 TRINITY_DN785_c0_g1~~TRINITY_DN785_c0_g1_i3.p1  ORF type:complete len:792 (-),score=86.23 TRINITY_DN785_c0_g1_i3:1284-3659(-)